MPTRKPIDLFCAPPLPVAPLDDAQRLACLRLIRTENVGPATFRALINHYGGATQALAALPEVTRRRGRRQPIQICSAAFALREIEAAGRLNVQLLFTIEPSYPAQLAFLDGAPPLLYAQGRTELLGQRTLAIVGARNCSAAGQTVARQFARQLGLAGLVIASGLARGIDAAAHRAALETGTVAVLAGGIDRVYPPEHRTLQRAIGEQGCLISEQPLGYEARARDFPRRNRIIAGVSSGVVVVEAARRSGALLTARLANDCGREVFAAPGNPLDPRAEGTNQLIKDGATMVTSGDDILAALPPTDVLPPAMSPIDPQPIDPQLTTPLEGQGQQPIDRDFAGTPPTQADDDDDPLNDQVESSSVDDAVALIERALGPVPISINDLARATDLPVRAVQVAVMELALAGRLELHGRQLVSLKPNR